MNFRVPRKVYVDTMQPCVTGITLLEVQSIVRKASQSRQSETPELHIAGYSISGRRQPG